MIKSARITFWLSPADKAQIQRAAKSLSITTAAFIRLAAIARAQDILQSAAAKPRLVPTFASTLPDFGASK